MAKTAQEKADLKAEKLYEKTHKRKYRLKPGDIVFNILNYLFFTLFTIACIFPFYYLFINTISDNDLVIKGLINFIPRGIHFDNYTALLNVSDPMVLKYADVRSDQYILGIHHPWYCGSV